MAMTENTVPPGEAPEPFQEEVHDPRRRDFINIAAVSFAGVGALAIVLPLINQMNPSADVLAQSTTEIDLSKIAPGPSGSARRCHRPSRGRGRNSRHKGPYSRLRPRPAARSPDGCRRPA